MVDTQKAARTYEHVTGIIDSIDRAVMAHVNIMGNLNTRKRMVVFSTAYSAAKTVVSLAERLNTQVSYNIKIASDDPMYDIVHTMLTTNRRDVKNLIASTRNEPSESRYNDPIALDGNDNNNNNNNNRSIALYYDDDAPQTLVIDGHRIHVKMDYPERVLYNEHGDAVEKKSIKRLHLSNSIILSCRTAAARDATLQAIQRELRSSKNGEYRGRAYVSTRYGGFGPGNPIARRPFSSVILKEGQGEELLADIQKFLSQRDKYEKIGMPWRRGILLEGAPGTGKTSLATALAYELKRDIHIINLASVESDNELIDSVMHVPQGSVLLVEDIDIIGATRERNDDREGITMSGLLNALDGVTTPAGLITIMTTNRADVIDPALLRPGRVDVRLHIGYVDNYQVNRFCEEFIGYIPENLPYVVIDDMITPAELAECIKSHLESPQEAATAITNHIMEVVCRRTESYILT